MTNRYLARVTEDADTGETTVHVLNEKMTAVLNAGGEFVDDLLAQESAAHALPTV